MTSKNDVTFMAKNVFLATIKYTKFVRYFPIQRKDKYINETASTKLRSRTNGNTQTDCLFPKSEV